MVYYRALQPRDIFVLVLCSIKQTRESGIDGELACTKLLTSEKCADLPEIQRASSWVNYFGKVIVGQKAWGLLHISLGRHYTVCVWPLFQFTRKSTLAVPCITMYYNVNKIFLSNLSVSQVPQFTCYWTFMAVGEPDYLSVVVLLRLWQIKYSLLIRSFPNFFSNLLCLGRFSLQTSMIKDFFEFRNIRFWHFLLLGETELYVWSSGVNFFC